MTRVYFRFAGVRLQQYSEYRFDTAVLILSSLFTDGVGLVFRLGLLDTFLVRPLPVLISVLTRWMSPEGISGVVLGAVLVTTGHRRQLSRFLDSRTHPVVRISLACRVRRRSPWRDAADSPLR